MKERRRYLIRNDRVWHVDVETAWKDGRTKVRFFNGSVELLGPFESRELLESRLVALELLYTRLAHRIEDASNRRRQIEQEIRELQLEPTAP